MAVACYWLLGEETNAERLHKHIENLPEPLASLNDPLPKAILAAYTARNTYLTDKNVPQKIVLRHCEIASQLLEDSLNYSSCKQQNGLGLVRKFFVHFRL